MPTRLTCPTCGRRTDLAHAKVPPFCSERCQWIDLGRWFNEEIGLPYEGDAEEAPLDDGSASPASTHEFRPGSP